MEYARNRTHQLQGSLRRQCATETRAVTIRVLAGTPSTRKFIRSGTVARRRSGKHPPSSALRFNFKGKSGKVWKLNVRDRRIAKVIRACQELPGQELFQYLDDGGETRDVTSSDVNAYLREISGDDITAKDFRTWHGTVLAALALQEF